MSYLTYSGKLVQSNNKYITSLPIDNTLKDYDNNIYTTVTIGTQIWIVENFKTTTYANGIPIPNPTIAGNWAADTSGGYCWYNNNISNKTPYGAMYNWYAVGNANGLAYLKRNGAQETGWRIPSQTDLDTLSTYLGGNSVAGGALKEAGFSHWASPNTGATNSSGFTALPNGRASNGTFIVNYGAIWTSDSVSSTTAKEKYLSNTDATFTNSTDDKKSGWYVRLMKDV